MSLKLYKNKEIPQTKAHEHTTCNYCGIEILEGQNCIIEPGVEPAEYYCLECGF